MLSTAPVRTARAGRAPRRCFDPVGFRFHDDGREGPPVRQHDLSRVFPFAACPDVQVPSGCAVSLTR